MSEYCNVGNRSKSSRTLAEHPEDYKASVASSESKKGSSTDESSTTEGQVSDTSNQKESTRVHAVCAIWREIGQGPHAEIASPLLGDSSHLHTTRVQEQQSYDQTPEGVVKNPRLEDPQQGSHATEKQQLPEHSLEGSSPDGNFVQVNLIAVLSMLVSVRDSDNK